MIEEKIKILLDTDVGDDIDDAFAISLLLNTPGIQTLGITTVFRNASMRARLAVQLLHAFGRDDIPVCAGTGPPLIQKEDIGQIPCQCNEETLRYSYDTDKNAVDFIRQTVSDNPGEITLLCIGPLTNAALFIRGYPEEAKLLKKIVLMGGCFYSHYTEWNVISDPEAAHIVFSSGIPVFAVGLDVTLKCRISAEQSDLILRFQDEQSGRGELSRIYKRWTKIHDWLPVLHDPLAVAAITDECFLHFEPERVEVMLEGKARGQTFNYSGLRWDPAETVANSSVFVADGVDGESFVRHYIEKVFDERNSGHDWNGKSSENPEEARRSVS